MPTVAEIFKTMDYGPAPESDAEARAWLAKHGAKFGHFVNGAWTKPGSTFDVFDPSTTDVLAKVTQGTSKDVDAAVAAARKAQRSWGKLSGHQRAKHLYALARMVQKHARLFAVVESMDNGKSIRETRDLDIPLVARHFYHHAGWAQLVVPGSASLPMLPLLGMSASSLANSRRWGRADSRGSESEFIQTFFCSCDDRHVRPANNEMLNQYFCFN